MGNQGKISRKQSSKMYVFLHISVLSFIFERKLLWLFYCKRRNPFSVFTSVSESIELGIRLLVRVTEILFLWLERLKLDQTFYFNRKKIVRPQHSLDRLKNAGKPWKEVTTHTVCASLPNLKSQRKYKEKRTFAALFPWNLALITHDAPSNVNPSISIDVHSSRI